MLNYKLGYKLALSLWSACPFLATLDQFQHRTQLNAMICNELAWAKRKIKKFPHSVLVENKNHEIKIVFLINLKTSWEHCFVLCDRKEFNLFTFSKNCHKMQWNTKF